MRTTIFSILLIITFSLNLKAQVDSLESINLLNEISSENKDSLVLLPDRILITQRVLWGEKGLMRNINFFELTPEKRQRELKLRRFMLVSHQVTGFATLGGMIAQGIIGADLYKGNRNLKDAHESVGALVNIGYITTASLSLFAPPKMINERKGFSSIKLHKALAILHISGMLATNILAGEMEGRPELKPYHRAAAFTAFGAFAASMIAIKF